MTFAACAARAAIRRYDNRLGAGLSHPLDHPLCIENVLELFGVVIGDYFVADVELMLQTPRSSSMQKTITRVDGFSEMRSLPVPG